MCSFQFQVFWGLIDQLLKDKLKSSDLISSSFSQKVASVFRFVCVFFLRYVAFIIKVVCLIFRQYVTFVSFILGLPLEKLNLYVLFFSQKVTFVCFIDRYLISSLDINGFIFFRYQWFHLPYILMVSSSPGDVARLLDVLQAEAPVGDVAAIRHVLLRRVGVNVDVERFRET
jgi:hypothetical protein